MKALVIDTETTGLDAPEVVEVAWVWVGIDGMLVAPGGKVSRFLPSKPILLGAMATHHIMDEDLADCPPSASFRLPDGVVYLIGHNVDFDWTAIGKPDVKRIDTLAMARSLWPDADSHSLGAMLYLVDRDNARVALQREHSAWVDVVNCITLLQHIARRCGPFSNFEALWLLSEEMRVPTRFTFGKHKGMAMADVPADYKRWLMKQPDVDPYLMKALRGR